MTQTLDTFETVTPGQHLPKATTNHTKAWVLHNLEKFGSRPGDLQMEALDLGPLGDDEVLVEPLYGCWEGNMGHAVARKPIDVAAYRGEDRVVIGNSGVVRVLKPGAAVRNVREGDVCVMCSGVWDAHGFTHRAFAYDAPGTVGVLARRTKMSSRQLVKIPDQSKYSLQQWASFTVRYMTAWANFHMAMGCWKALQPVHEEAGSYVWGWGGGTAFAELTLAKHYGFHTALISSDPQRLSLIESAGVTPVDRRAFAGLNLNESKMKSDAAYAEQYQQAERRFLNEVMIRTEGRGVSIFVDHVGGGVTNATLRALARPGVITTSGWKAGMKMSTNRAMAAMQWQTHVHTHYCRYGDGERAVEFAEKHGWIAPAPEKVYDFDEIPQLAADYEAGTINSYFPVFKVNA